MTNLNGLIGKQCEGILERGGGARATGTVIGWDKVTDNGDRSVLADYRVLILTETGVVLAIKLFSAKFWEKDNG